LTLQGKRTLRQAAKELGVPESLLYDCRHRFAPRPGAETGTPRTLEEATAEITRLRAKLGRMHQRENVQKIVGHPLRSGWERFARGEAIKGEHPVEGLRELLKVSRSGYYRWRRARPSRRATQDAALREHIVRFHARSWRTYGAPRIV
jgi:hypothetical protein